MLLSSDSKSFSKCVSKSFSKCVSKSFSKCVSKSFSKCASKSFSKCVSKSFSKCVSKSSSDSSLFKRSTFLLILCLQIGQDASLSFNHLVKHDL